MEKDLDNIKVNSVIKSEAVTLVSGLLSLIVSVIGMLLITLIPADVSLDKYVGVLLPDLLKACMPEPYEMPQYALFLVLYPVAFLAFYRLLSKRTYKNPEVKLNKYVMLNFLTLFILFIVSVFLYLISFDYYWDKMCGLTPDNAVVSIGAAYLLSLLLKSVSSLSLKKQRIAFCIIAASAVLVYLICALRVDYFHMQVEGNQHHFYAWWYPIYKVLSGKTVGVDFENLYGLYPYFAAPLIKLFGGANSGSVACYVALCQLTVAAGYFAIAYTFVKNKVLGGIAAFGASVFGPFSVIMGSVYPQYHPTRTLFISITFIAVCVYHSVRNIKAKTLLNVIMAFVLGLGIAWNIESGLVCLIVWAGYHIYVKAQEYKLLSSEVLKETVKYVVSSIVSLAVFFAFAELVTYLRAGQFLSTDAILFGIKVFAGTGFYMIKIIPGIWVAIAAMLVVSLTISIVCLSKYSKINFDSNTATGLFVVSITAMGAFSYFMGRSYPTNVLSLFVYCVLLAAMLIDCYSDKNKTISLNDKKAENKLIKVNKIKSALCIYIVALCLVVAFNYIANEFTSSQEYELYGNNQSVEMFDDAVDKIQTWADENNEGTIPNMLVYFSAYYDVLMQRDATEDVCEQIDWFYLDNAHSYIDFANEHSDESFVIDEEARGILIKCFPDEWNSVEQKFSLDRTDEFLYRHYRKMHLYFYKPIK